MMEIFWFYTDEAPLARTSHLITFADVNDEPGYPGQVSNA